MMKIFLTPKNCAILLLLSAVLFIVQIFMPLISGDDGIFALTDPVQAKYEAVERLDTAAIAIYVLHVLGIALMGIHMLCGFEKSRRHVLFKAGLILLLIAALAAIYRMHRTYDIFPELFSRVGMPLYINAVIYILLSADALTEHRLYPANVYILQIAALFFLIISLYNTISGIFDIAAGKTWSWALIYWPTFVHYAMFCAGLSGFIRLHKRLARM